MGIQSRSFTVEPLKEDDILWFVEVAAVNMLVEEVRRPELVNLEQLYGLSFKGLQEGTAFVVKKDGECVGALGAILLPNLFNPEIRTLAEIFWYVLPSYRNTRAGAMLLNAFDKKAVEVADEATLSLLGSSSINIKTLEKRGFHLGEFAFRKNIGGK